jgi:glutamate racemase
MPLRVGVLGTERTVASHAYEHEIQKRNPNITVTQAACNNLAGMIETLGSESREVTQEAKECVQVLLSKGDVDDVLLACTHYELVSGVISTALPEGTKLFHQPSIVSKSLEDYVERHPEIESRIQKQGKRAYLTTGVAATVSSHSQLYMGERVEFEGIL